MRTRVLLAPDLADALHAAGLGEADAIFDLGGDPTRTSVVALVERPVAGTRGRFHLKRYLYPSWRKARHLLGRGTLGGRPPELNEFLALRRLHALGVPAVRPVAAAASWRGPVLAAHALLTEHVPDAPDLAARLGDPADPLVRDAALRRHVLDLVASGLARMHAADFVHRDVHARNVLVRLHPEPRIAFLDCRRAGPPTRRRGVAHDLASLEFDLAGRVGARERLRMLRTYLGRGLSCRATCRTVRRELGRSTRRRAGPRA